MSVQVRLSIQPSVFTSFERLCLCVFFKTIRHFDISTHRRPAHPASVPTRHPRARRPLSVVTNDEAGIYCTVACRHQSSCTHSTVPKYCSSMMCTAVRPPCTPSSRYHTATSSTVVIFSGSAKAKLQKPTSPFSQGGLGPNRRRAVYSRPL